MNLSLTRPAEPPGAAPLVAVVDCQVCDGRGLVLARPVPSGQDVEQGMTLVDCLIETSLVRCPGCAGRGAELRSLVGAR